MNTVVAIDPGRSGGIAVQFGLKTECQRMPATEEAVVRCLHEVVRIALATGLPPVFFIEKVGGYCKGRPQPGYAMFNFGDNYGFLKGVVKSMRFVPELVAPQKWQKPLALGKASACPTKAVWKNKLKHEAQRRFPHLRVTLKTADALLLLVYGLEQMERISATASVVAAE